MAAAHFDKMSQKEKVAFIERAIFGRTIPDLFDPTIEFYDGDYHPYRTYAIILVAYKSCVTDGGCDEKDVERHRTFKLSYLLNKSKRGPQFYENMLQRFSDVFVIYPYIFEDVANFKDLMKHVIDYLSDAQITRGIHMQDMVPVFAAYVDKALVPRRTLKFGIDYYSEVIHRKYLRCYLAFRCLSLSQRMCWRILKMASKFYFEGLDFSNIPMLRGLAIANKIRDFSKVASEIAAEEDDGKLEDAVKTFCRLIFTDEDVYRIIGEDY